LAVRGDQLVSLVARSTTGFGADIVTRDVSGGGHRLLGFVLDAGDAW
jgi:hypothetical protein